MEKKRRRPLFARAALALGLVSIAASAFGAAPASTPPGKDHLAWWREARFGLFVHWGPVSLKGTEISWSRANSNPAHPNHGAISVDVYDNLYKEFNPTRFNAEAWAELARAAGTKYVVLTAKHCDGFCLWPSKTSPYNITATPFRHDICGELAAAVRKAGLRVGWYYSPMDWRDPDCRTPRNSVYVAAMQGHLRELLSGYGPIDLLWFDTDGCPAPWDQEKTYGLVRGLQPNIIINNRLDLGSAADYDAMPIAPQADYYTPEQRIGEYDDTRPWETCMTLGTQWSWKPDDQIKPVAECIRILARCAGGDGNLLLNVGPMPSGEIEPRQADVLHGIGKWLQKNGESIHGTRGGPFKPNASLASTRTGSTVYVHLLLEPAGGVVALPPLPARIVSSGVLGGGQVETRQTPEAITLKVGTHEPDGLALVVKLDLDRPAAGIPAVAVPALTTPPAPATTSNGRAEIGKSRPEIAAYYFPNYHPGDPRNVAMKGAGWSEWDLVKAARPRFAGHVQPRVPLWGYTDESDPSVMATKIDAAADHGIDAFLFDWYHYDTGPFLNRCLDQGYLRAANRQRVKFALMWANHDWLELHPYKRGTPQQVLFQGKVSPEGFERITTHVIRDYFSQPSYWTIEGKPYFSFYDLSKLVENFGSVAATRAALGGFRDRTRKAGLPGLHLNAVAWGQPILPGEKQPLDLPGLIHALGFDSATSYVWVHHALLPDRETDYNAVRDAYNVYWDHARTAYGIPYFPNVSVGWDSSPRAHQGDQYGNFGYPFTNTITGNTPGRFRAALKIAQDRMTAQSGGPRVLTINSWNEWTEGSYLEPDTVNGMKYLEAVRDVFGVRPGS